MSLAIHAGALLALRTEGALPVPHPARAWRIALAPLPAAEWDANREPSPPPQPRPSRRREIVSLPARTRETAHLERPPPGDVRFLAERDQTVERETVAPEAVPSLEPLPSAADAAPGSPGEGGERAAAGPGPEAGAGVPSTPEAELAQAAPGSGLAVPPPARGTTERGPAVDGIGLAEGPETRVNARRFAAAAYWTEVGARLQGAWQRRALVATAQHDPAEDTYFDRKRSVVVGLAVDGAGAVRDARVVEPSRLDFYDALAVAVVREQQPYPRPPPAAVGADGTARIAIRFEWLPSVLRKAMR